MQQPPCHQTLSSLALPPSSSVVPRPPSLVLPPSSALTGKYPVGAIQEGPRRVVLRRAAGVEHENPVAAYDGVQAVSDGDDGAVAKLPAMQKKIRR